MKPVNIGKVLAIASYYITIGLIASAIAFVLLKIVGVL
jgi:hypothetical protein